MGSRCGSKAGIGADALQGGPSVPSAFLLPLFWLPLLLPAGCGEAGDPDAALDLPVPSDEVGEEEAVEPMPPLPPEGAGVTLVFHRGEEPVEVTRSLDEARAVDLPTGMAPGADESAQSLARALLLLVKGPLPEEEEEGIHSFFSPETESILREVRLEDGLAVVDFRDFRPLIPNASSSAGSQAFLRELNQTVFRNSQVQEVDYQLEGSCEAFWAFLQRGCARVSRNDTPDSRY